MDVHKFDFQTSQLLELIDSMGITGLLNRKKLNIFLIDVARSKIKRGSKYQALVLKSPKMVYSSMKVIKKMDIEWPFKTSEILIMFENEHEKHRLAFTILPISYFVELPEDDEIQFFWKSKQKNTFPNYFLIADKKKVIAYNLQKDGVYEKIIDANLPKLGITDFNCWETGVGGLHLKLINKESGASHTLNFYPSEFKF